MHRLPVQLDRVDPQDLRPGQIWASPQLLERLGMKSGDAVTVHFGLRSAPIRFEATPDLLPQRLLVNPAAVSALALVLGCDLTVWRSGPAAVTLGPLVGLMISDAKLKAVVNGERDSAYCRYAQSARETGALLTFFAGPVETPQCESVFGYVHECCDTGPCHWRPVTIPLPKVVYDRAFGATGRAAAAQVRSHWGALGTTVVNSPLKITKLTAFGALEPDPALNAHLPYTKPLTHDSLTEAIDRFADLYVKPNGLSKGQGVLRLTKADNGWLLQSRSGSDNLVLPLADRTAVLDALTPLIHATGSYVIQEGLALARYLGNRFDFRSMVQKNGLGQWCVTGLVARIAPEGSVITSPRSGGQTATAEQALQHAFGERCQAVSAEIHRVSLAIAQRMEEQLGPCAELGLDLGALEDGRVMLIEVNGIPLRVSLERLEDPLITSRITRYPIHYAASLDTAGAGTPQGPPTDSTPPLVAILLGAEDLARLDVNPRYRHMHSAALAAGVQPLFITNDGVFSDRLRVTGWTLVDDRWVQVETRLPAIIYNRATHGSPDARRAVKSWLRWLTDRHGVVLLNSANSFSKTAVYDALRFFSDTARLVPETIPYRSAADLRAMLLRHRSVFVKANHGSHGADVVRIAPAPRGFEVLGRIQGARVEQRFPDVGTLHAFLSLLIRAEAWVLQQGISLPAVDGRIIDLRAIAQKDGEGRWCVPLVLVRQAKPGNIATNMSQGGEPFDPEAFLAHHSETLSLPPGTMAAITDAAVKTAMALESRFSRLGEIGIDIGTSPEGDVWVFEANTKPLHPQVSFITDDQLLRLPFRYAAYLARRARAGGQSGLPGPSEVLPD